jgi:hypothetical protein
LRGLYRRKALDLIIVPVELVATLRAHEHGASLVVFEMHAMVTKRYLKTTTEHLEVEQNPLSWGRGVGIQQHHGHIEGLGDRSRSTPPTRWSHRFGGLGSHGAERTECVQCL